YTTAPQLIYEHHTHQFSCYTDRSGRRVQTHTRPALSQELSLQHQGGTMRWMHRQVQLVSYSCTCFCCCCFEVWSCPTIHREPTRCSRLA
ncbi:unnamed protein product, partial [Laminaria digitata]